MKNFTDQEVDDMIRRQERRNTLSEVQQEVEKLERLTPVGCGWNSYAAEENGLLLSRQDVLDLLKRLQEQP